MSYGKVIKVTSNFFEVDRLLKVGEFVKTGKCLAVVTDVSEEVPDIMKYMKNIEIKDLIDNLPDVLDEAKSISKCYILLSEELPKIGDVVTYANDDEIKNFHIAKGEFKIPYFFKMVKDCEFDVCLSVLKRLKKVFPENTVIGVLLKEVSSASMRAFKS